MKSPLSKLELDASKTGTESYDGVPDQELVNKIGEIKDDTTPPELKIVKN